MSQARMIKLGAALLALLAASPGRAAETGTFLKADAIRATPYGDGKLVATLPAGTKVAILKKSGGWLQVKSAKGTGWARMLSIRRGEASPKAGTAAGVLSLASGRAGTGQVVATTGIRGLSEEELKTAKFDENELKLAESYAASEEDARGFAGKGKLAARKFDYLPAPK